jgi:DNA-binding NarL/FixJ family response regulator
VRDRGNPLSERERTVLRLVAEGLASKQIGRQLALAERTAKVHVTGAMNKLGANTRSQAVALALGRQLL